MTLIISPDYDISCVFAENSHDARIASSVITLINSSVKQVN